MKYLVQRPLPDELLGSVWIRTRRRAGLGIGQVTRELTGRKHAPTLFSVSHTLEIAHALGVSQLAFLWEHTLFPYVAAYALPGTFQESLSKALNAGQDGLGASCMQSASDYVRTRRLCPSCAVEDLHQWGESYWRREHHLPACFVCLKHAERLLHTNIRVIDKSPWPDVLPHEALKAASNKLPSLPDWDLAFSLAEASVRLLHRDEVGPVKWSLAGYRRKLEDKGLVAPERMLSRRKLANWGQETFGSTLGQIGFRPADKTLNWLAHLVRVNTFTPLVTVKHVLFNVLLAKGECLPGMLTHVPTGKPKRFLKR